MNDYEEFKKELYLFIEEKNYFNPTEFKIFLKSKKIIFQNKNEIISRIPLKII